jgi:serine protease Do
MNNNIRKMLIMVFMAAVSVFLTCSATGYGMDSNIDVKEITQKVAPSVVRVEAINGMRKVATGVVIGQDGYIVTTALVSPIGTNIFVKNSIGEKFDAELVGMDPVTHIALVKAEGGKWDSIEWGDKEEVDIGSWIGVISISPENSTAVTSGIVSSISRDKIRLNVSLMPGSSGSPAISEKGRMVGLIRGVYSGQTTWDVLRNNDPRSKIVGGSLSLSIVGTPVSGLAEAIPIDVVRKVATEIKETGKVQRGWLGISIIENQVDEIEIFDVDAGSPAEKAGIKKGDIFVEFDGEKVTSPNILAHDIRMHRPGDKVKIVIKRDDKTKNIKVEFGEYSEKNIMEEFKEKYPLLFSPDKFRLEKITKPEGWYFSLVEKERNHIGIYLEEINRDLSEYFGVNRGTGLLVTKIVKDGPAEKAGLQVGDVIIKADGKRIEKMKELEEIIQRKEEEEKISLEVVRNTKVMKIDVIVEREEEDFPFLSDFQEAEVMKTSFGEESNSIGV